jgi:hypothetical protein
VHEEQKAEKRVSISVAIWNNRKFLTQQAGGQIRLIVEDHQKLVIDPI